MSISLGVIALLIPNNIMKIINSDDFHDYVIKDNKLIGEFEQMYKNAKNIPWDQHNQENWLDIRLTIELLKKQKPFDYILDFSSGLGYYLNTLGKNVGEDNCKLFGLDISETACKKAKKLFHGNDFKVFDLMQNPNIKKPLQLQNKYKNRLFSIRGTIWYVYPKIRNVVKNIAYYVCKNDTLLLSQNFPPLDSSFVGKNIISHPQELVNYFSVFFDVMKSIWFEDTLSRGNDNWFICLFKRKKK